jgi:hypothetical protein
MQIPLWGTRPLAPTEKTSEMESFTYYRLEVTPWGREQQIPLRGTRPITSVDLREYRHIYKYGGIFMFQQKTMQEGPLASHREHSLLKA